MQNRIEDWENVPFEKYEREVFHLQRRIFCSSLRGDRTQVHLLQKLLVRSFAARSLAVARVSEQNAGKDTPGVDGERTLTGPRKLAIAQELRLDEPIEPVRRVWIPKPGTLERRPLGIPTIRNRALQALIVLALEPAWECKFSTGTFGFRKGRSCHDAIAAIRTAIQWQPKWVLDADIEKFFDHVNHEALLEKLDTFPTMRLAIGRILKSGSLESTVWTATVEGTPQGGVLSPLLANITLCGLEDAIIRTYKKWKLANGRVPQRKPNLALYADDFVVCHANREIIERCREFIADWLTPLGLRLHPEKTRIVHTLIPQDGAVGFDFLGHHIRQFETGKYAVKSCYKQIYTHIIPSKASVRRALIRTNEIIEEMLRCPGSKGTRAGETSPEEILIYRLNRFSSGWSNFFRYSNAKETLSRLDSLVWWKLWRTMVRRYRREGKEWIVDEFYKGSGKWQFTCRDSPREEKPVLRRFNETIVSIFRPALTTKSYFDGDWAYWGTRLGRYPCLPPATGMLLKRQKGRCRKCKTPFNRQDRFTTVDTLSAGQKENSLQDQLVHWHCRSPSNEA